MRIRKFFGALRLVVVPLVAGMALLAAGHARAGVLQLVDTSFLPGGGGPSVASSDEIFVPTSADVNRNVLASVGQAPPGGPGFFATSSAGVFGQIGLDARLFGVAPGSILRTSVLIGSDEFVNVSGLSGTVRSNFIIDGGFLADFFSTNTMITMQLEVGAEVLGSAGPESDRVAMGIATRLAANLGGAGGFFPGFDGGRYTVTYSTNSSGAPSLSTTAEGGLDLGATFDANTRRVEIPFSLQSLDLGVLGPGDRLLIGYRAHIEMQQDGIAEGIFGAFADPFNLSSNSILSSLQFIPNSPGGNLPEPRSLALVLLALGAATVVAGRKRALAAG